jgi:hypothetical protein
MMRGKAQHSDPRSAQRGDAPARRQSPRAAPRIKPAVARARDTWFDTFEFKANW